MFAALAVLGQSAILPDLIRGIDVVDGLAPAKELRHRIEDLAVRVAVEILGGQHLENDVHRIVLEKNSAQHRPLCFESVRGDLAGSVG